MFFVFVQVEILRYENRQLRSRLSDVEARVAELESKFRVTALPTVTTTTVPVTVPAPITVPVPIPTTTTSVNVSNPIPAPIPPPTN